MRMNKTLFFMAMMAATLTATAQLKPRPDAFPPVQEQLDGKAVTMASTAEEMADWDRYPTYPVYLEMMQRWAESFPLLCHVDTIGTSIRGRLILSLYIDVQTDDDLYRPEFFYSSTIHGDEVTGFVMMLRLIDTLLNGYNSNPLYTDLINRTRISINPLANPDGTYRNGNNTVQGAVRYNANMVDLNRNYPNPFAVSSPTPPYPPQGGTVIGDIVPPRGGQGGVKAALQPENQAMIEYMEAHHFRLSANLHGGAEVMNYPWDSFTSAEMPHPSASWWQEVCKRFVDTSRTYDNNHFRDTYNCGYTAGGDWYVITGGRQDYVNYYLGCNEMTMEISTQKTLSSNRLPEYWDFLQHSLVNYIGEIHNAPDNPIGVESPLSSLHSPLTVYPNPACDIVTVDGLQPNCKIELFDIAEHRILSVSAPSEGRVQLDLATLRPGVYILRCGTAATKLVKR